MIPTPFGIASQSRPGTAVTSVNIVSVKPFVIDSPVVFSEETVALTGLSSNVLFVLATARANSAVSDLSGTWADEAVTEVVDVDLELNGGAAGWAGSIRDAAPNGSFVLTGDGPNYGDLVGWAISFDRMAASPIAASAPATVVRVDQNAYSVTIDPTNPLSRLVGFVGAIRSNMYPMTLSAGWTVQDAPRRSDSIACVIGSRLAGGTDPLTMTATGPVAAITNDWVSFAVEVLPA